MGYPVETPEEHQGITRRNLLKGIGAAATVAAAGSLAEACAPTGTQTQPQLSQPTPAPVEVQPTQSARVVTETAVAEKDPMLEQARNAGLDAFVKLLGKFQGAKTDTYELNSVITSDIKSFPKGAIVSKGDTPSNQSPSSVNDLLSSRWIYSDNVHAITLGEAEFKRFTVSLKNAFQLTPADQTNGVDWQGEVEVGYIERHRSIKPYFMTDKGAFRMVTRAEQDTQDYPRPTQDFSDWKDAKMKFSLILKNGKWDTGQHEVVYPVRDYNVTFQQCSPTSPPNTANCVAGRIPWK